MIALFAHAGGLSGRSDLPIPEWLFGWAAAMVLVISFVALAVLWPEAKLEGDRWRPLPGVLGRIPASRAVEIICGAIGAALLGIVIYTGLRGTQSPAANFAPTFVFVIFWIGLVPVSVLFGDVLRAFNPWRAIGRAVGWAAGRVVSAGLPAPLAYPERVGHWPATIGVFAFAVLELVISGGDKPETVAIATLVYSALTFIAMALYGVEDWSARGEAYSVYFNLFSRISPFETRDRVLGVRPPLSGLAHLKVGAGTVPLLAVMIGSVTFDGAGEAPIWTGIAPDISKFFEDVGLSPQPAFELTFLVGLTAAILLVYGFYRLGVLGARSVGGGFSAERLSRAFAHSLVPIALAYVMAHYVTYLLFRGQAIVFLASDPLGDGSDLFGTAKEQIDYGLIGATATWYWQVAFVVAGHVAALTLAHDRALALYEDAKLAVRSQYWMLAVMVGFTSLALWLLSQANT
ncbi:MAG: fenitrothion hydrolase [Thermoleophilaceae bacterium]|nr:fenitrothion hydrolase [Thermoleophilaceae bacterium]